MSVSDFSKELFSDFECYRSAILPRRSTKYELLQIISFLFYIYKIFVQLVLRNTLLQISLIESNFYKKIDKWYIAWKRVVQRVKTNNNEW